MANADNQDQAQAQSSNTSITISNVMNKVINKVIVIDTETIGLPEQTRYQTFYNPSNYSKYKTSRVIEIGYYIYTSSGEFISKRNILVKPENFKVENSEIHGITQEHLEREGISLIGALSILAEDIASCDTIVAHNLQFDFNVLAAECYRILANGHNEIARKLVDKMTSMKKVCTMELGMQKLGRTRRIKLSHLYEELTDEEWDQQHRAEDDARVCGICYWLLVDML